ncbi:MAG TPA: peptidoglycan bridge formation glycyltransferase FemA/FemB family protein [Candidatus Limnocylindria bacterium]|jgi:lipid II:glycine glycyltransferase (peptidoglycan interpeptide bridge formation enzyme)
MFFRTAEKEDARHWQEFVEAMPAADFLHDWGWADVAAFDGEPQRRYILEDAGRIVAVAAIQSRSIGRGRTFWYVPHGPILDYAAPRGPEIVAAFVSWLKRAAHDNGAIAVKLEPRLAAGDPAIGLFDLPDLVRLPDTLQVAQTRILPVRGDAELMDGFDKDTRYAVRRAVREGVEVWVFDDPGDLRPIDDLHALVEETQQRAGFPMPALERYRIAWHALAKAGRASILEARRAGELLAAGMLVIEGDRSFYLFSGSRREPPGETKRYASYALQWGMLQLARQRGVREHDLWGIAPVDAGPEHPWYGVGLFKKGFGGREVTWAGSWDVVADPTLYRVRATTSAVRGWLRGLRG